MFKNGLGACSILNTQNTPASYRKNMKVERTFLIINCLKYN